MSELKSRVAVITGAGQGIGLAIARRLAEMGASVGILDIKGEQIELALEFLHRDGYTAHGEICDVAEQAAVESAFAGVRSKLGPVGILVNNAGIIRFETLEATRLETYERTMAINVRGVFLCTRAAMGDMVAAKWGKIVTVGSSAGKTGGSNAQGVYGASKAASMTLMKSFARELAPHGINVNAVAPALIETQMLEGLGEFTDLIPLGRLGQPEDVANAVGFLCSERSSFITGEVLDINGGFLID